MEHQDRKSKLLSIYDRIMELDIYVPGPRGVVVPYSGGDATIDPTTDLTTPDHPELPTSERPSLYEKYVEASNKHNCKIDHDPHHIDAGFDVFVPESVDLHEHSLRRINFRIRTKARMCWRIGGVVSEFGTHNTGYHMYPRSSLSKTNLRLANSVGIIDAGYRGDLIGVFDVIRCTDANTCSANNEQMTIHRYDRLVQICAPGLVPILVNVHRSGDAEDPTNGQTTTAEGSTLRGEGGFGSTGR